MHYPAWIKRISKITILLLGAVTLEPILTQIVILCLAPIMTKQLGCTGGKIMIFIEVMGIPLFLVCIVIGILGGLWIGGKVINGFVISLIFCLYWFSITVIFHGVSFDLIMLLLLIGLLLIPAIGSLIYGIFSKSSQCSAENPKVFVKAD